jgi:hypothetical protein
MSGLGMFWKSHKMAEVGIAYSDNSKYLSTLKCTSVSMYSNRVECIISIVRTRYVFGHFCKPGYLNEHTKNLQRSFILMNSQPSYSFLVVLGAYMILIFLNRQQQPSYPLLDARS